jgi:hypothetical protein
MKGAQFSQDWPEVVQLWINVAFYGTTVALFSVPVTNFNAFLTFYVTSKANIGSQVAYIGANVALFSAFLNKIQSFLAFIAT